MVSYNPSCYLPSAIAQHLPDAISCAPPPTYAQALLTTLSSPLSSTYSTLSALVSLPFLSFLVFPIFGSWSTSLNLLFFYLTWTTLVLSQGPLRIEILSTLAIRTLFYLLPSLAFFAFDALVPSAAEGFKATGAAALPLKSPSRRKTLRYARFLAWSTGNVLLSTLLRTAIAFALKAWYPTSPALSVSIALPAPFNMLKGLVKGYLLREVLTYSLHRYFLHSDSNMAVARYLTERHESWYHSLPTPIPMSASYDHPAAYVVRSFVPQVVPAVLFRFHLLTYLLYLAVMCLEETFAYSGYSTVPTNFILGGIARRTDAHVACGGEGNYGCLGLVDWVMGTSVGEDILDDLEGEADKHEVGPRVRKKVASGKGKGRKAIEDVRRENGRDEAEYRPEKERVHRKRRSAA